MNKKYKSWYDHVKLVVGSVLVLGLFLSSVASVEAANVHTDVTKSNTHYHNIVRATELGFMGGYGDGTFKPFRELTRSDVVKTLGKYILKEKGQTLDSYDESGVVSFSDVPSSYFDEELYKYSLIVKNEGVFSGNQGKLMPNDLMTRQQMAKVLVNTFDLKDKSGVKSGIKDLSKADKSFRTDINILFKNGVTSVRKYNPHDNTIRGQFATFLVRAYDAKDRPIVDGKLEESLDPQDLWPDEKVDDIIVDASNQESDGILFPER